MYDFSLENKCSLCFVGSNELYFIFVYRVLLIVMLYVMCTEIFLYFFLFTGYMTRHTEMYVLSFVYRNQARSIGGMGVKN